MQPLLRSLLISRRRSTPAPIEGKQQGTIRTFLGIPYAAPPVGDLRWKPPAPAANGRGSCKATEFGAHCMQGRCLRRHDVSRCGDSEDCLTLNVWTPAKKGRKAAGDGLDLRRRLRRRRNFGAASARRELAARGVIVVSMIYRLGIFGFLVHPELAKESGRNSAGNYGLLDQVAAIKWVHATSQHFGGDPANVTIFGESAGSFSVSAQMASPLAKGLFKKPSAKAARHFQRRFVIRTDVGARRKGFEVGK